MAKTGRKQKPYETSWGEIIPGLAHDTSGRWRIAPTGFRYTEPDEAIAVKKAKALLGLDKATTTDITVTLADLLPVNAPSNTDEITPAHADRLTNIFDAAPDIDDSSRFVDGEMQEAEFKLPIPDAILWPWLTRMLRDEPEFLAQRTGDHRLLALRGMQGGPPAVVNPLEAPLQRFVKEGVKCRSW